MLAVLSVVGAGKKAVRRVVITGIGMVTPLGADVESSWRSALAGESGIGEITLFDASTFPCRIAGEVKQPQHTLHIKETEGLNRGARFGVAAAQMARSNAGTNGWPEDRCRIGVSMGCGRPGHHLEAVGFLSRGKVDEMARTIGNTPLRGSSLEAGTDYIARVLDARGPTFSIFTACSSGTQAIGQAFRSIQRGDADVMLAGGYDSMVDEIGVIGFALLGVLSTNNSRAESACRPFDRDRNGLVIGEGAGVLVLEDLELAEARGASILAEVSGYGASMNAYRITDPDPEATGPVEAINAALQDAGLRPGDIGYINAHGTATWANDPLETLAIKKVFGPGAYNLPISSTKSMTGHLMSAAGAVESVFCVLSLRDGVVPPTINLEHPDRRCDLDYVPKQARAATLSHLLNNSFAFGGINTALVFSRFQ